MGGSYIAPIVRHDRCLRHDVRREQGELDLADDQPAHGAGVGSPKVEERLRR
jgi:hypothetical protein